MIDCGVYGTLRKEFVVHSLFMIYLIISVHSRHPEDAVSSRDRLGDSAAVRLVDKDWCVLVPYNIDEDSG